MALTAKLRATSPAPVSSSADSTSSLKFEPSAPISATRRWQRAARVGCAVASVVDLDGTDPEEEEEETGKKSYYCIMFG